MALKLPNFGVFDLISSGYICIIMMSRVIFVLFAVAFIAYTWLHSGQAKSSEAVNNPKATCKCTY